MNDSTWASGRISDTHECESQATNSEARFFRTTNTFRQIQIIESLKQTVTIRNKDLAKIETRQERQRMV